MKASTETISVPAHFWHSGNKIYGHGIQNFTPDSMPVLSASLVSGGYKDLRNKCRQYKYRTFCILLFVNFCALMDKIYPLQKNKICFSNPLISGYHLLSKRLAKTV